MTGNDWAWIDNCRGPDGGFASQLEMQRAIHSSEGSLAPVATSIRNQAVYVTKITG